MTMILREDIFDHFNFTIPTRKELVALINYVPHHYWMALKKSSGKRKRLLPRM